MPTDSFKDAVERTRKHLENISKTHRRGNNLDDPIIFEYVKPPKSSKFKKIFPLFKPKKPTTVIVMIQNVYKNVPEEKFEIFTESEIITLFEVEYKPVITEDTMPVTEKQKEEPFYQKLIKNLPKIYMYENQKIPEYVRYTLNKMENTYKGEASKNQKIKILNESQDKILIQFNPRLYDEIKEENQIKITEYQQKIEESKQKKEKKSKKRPPTFMEELTDVLVHNNNAASPPSSRSNSPSKTRSKGGGKKNRKTRKRTKKSN
jgi:hypothetical protein